MSRKVFNYLLILLSAILIPTLISFDESSGIGRERIGSKDFRPIFKSDKSQEDINREVDSVFATLSLKEKVAQLFIIDFTSYQNEKEKKLQDHLVKRLGVGGIISMRDSLVPAVNRMNELNSLAEVPLLVSIDGEWGIAMRYRELPRFPRQMQLGALSSDSLIYEMGYLIGRECRDYNIHINYAPSVDINNNPDNPAINTRSFGEDKNKVATYGAAYARGMRDAGVAGSAKHFPGHGDTDVDSHEALPILPFSRERLDSLELYPFRELINQDIDMVMVGHLDVPTLDAGVPSSISKRVITDLLRNELGFDGIICTDALNMDGVANSSGLKKREIPLAAYRAGADILLMAEDVERAITRIVREVRRGVLSERELDVKVKKLLALKSRMGLFEVDYNPIVNMSDLENRVIKQENLKLINEIAKNSLTLITNSDETIPIERASSKKIGYIGFKGTILCGSEVFKNAILEYGDIDTVLFGVNPSVSEVAVAKERFKDYDLVVAGIHNTDSRPQLNFGLDSLPMNYLSEWAAEQPMVVAYFGNPYAVNRIKDVDNFKAFLIGYSNTDANNLAAVQIIFGKAPALGVLPVSLNDYKLGESILIED